MTSTHISLYKASHMDKHEINGEGSIILLQGGAGWEGRGKKKK